MFALDTNTIIYFLKKAGRVRDVLLSVPPSDVSVPAIVLYELEVGIHESNQPAKRRAQLESLLQSISILSFNEQSAKLAAEIEGRLRRSGSPIGPLDTLIAGTALAHHATLVTHNVKEFNRVPSLQVVDWY